ncbi:MAG: veratrol--corrinoid protein metyltransferase [Coriobacteriia bacterium]|nr:veratrol--corrinoid protein metyltransferase [Coriobacteriia bacterium]
MPRLSKKDNFMRLANREVPEYIPTYSLFWGSYRPPILRGTINEDGSGKDIFGVERVIDSAGILPAMPKTHDFILDDITKWRDVIKTPVLDQDDSVWIDMAKEAWRAQDPNVPFGVGASNSYFQPLVAFMGFTEGLSACFEEPEEVKALMEYLSDFAVGYAKKMIKFFEPDFGFLADDIAHERNPFLSLEMFQDLIAPYWRRYYAVYLDAGLPVGHHNCGHFELYLDDLVDMGVSFWDPVQSSNDYAEIKARFGTDLAMCASPEGRFWNDDTPEEQIRTEFRDFINLLAPGGGYAAFDGLYADPMPGASEAQINRNIWMREEFDALKFSFYE